MVDPLNANTRDLIHCYRDGNMWCAIYPMGSNLMDCEAVAFMPENYHTQQGGLPPLTTRDIGGHQAIQKLRDENPNIQCSYYLH